MSLSGGGMPIVTPMNGTLTSYMHPPGRRWPRRWTRPSKTERTPDGRAGRDGAAPIGRTGRGGAAIVCGAMAGLQESGRLGHPRRDSPGNRL
ncbi:hypothetical protein Skr01_61340 [Sphaerisporangium krabiense]|nr:hypothetical protein Skr01_61340 [Sphaerisporangium krabiense]